MSIISFFQSTTSTFIEFLYAPLINSNMLWIIIPVLFAVILMDLYFKRYPREGIGHHKSLENTIFLVFICFNLLYFVSNYHPTPIKITLIIIYFIFSIIIGLMDFYHKLPTELIFKRSTKFIVAYISYVTIILIYSNILNELTFLKTFEVVFSITALFFLFVGINKTMNFLQPKSYGEIEHFLKHIEDDIKKAHQETDGTTFVKKKKVMVPRKKRS